MHGLVLSNKKYSLTKWGYKASLPIADRELVIDKAVKKYGALPIFRKLNSLYNANQNKTIHKTYRRDKNYVKKTYKSQFVVKFKEPRLVKAKKRVLKLPKKTPKVAKKRSPTKVVAKKRSPTKVVTKVGGATKVVTKVGGVTKVVTKVVAKTDKPKATKVGGVTKVVTKKVGSTMKRVVPIRVSKRKKT